MYFDGPNTRLITWRASVSDGRRVGLEEPCLELDLGPVGWFDYEGLNAAFGETARTAMPQQDVDASADYRPRGVPHPIAAVLRGIGSEVSPRLLDVIRPTDICVTGIAFDLDFLHPNLLVAVLVDLRHDQILELRRLHPGPEYLEGELYFASADLTNSDTRSIVADRNWVPGGQASLLRTLELFDAISRDRLADFSQVFSMLRDPRG
jgi:hypothetical protein